MAGVLLIDPDIRNSLAEVLSVEGGRSVTLRTIWKLSRALNVRPRDLLPS
jgi:hypothetical protein